ncbi:MAG: hypothetical protein WC455_18355 [Dehalococcoidia bacterium]|jgi:hypothetical protein
MLKRRPSEPFWVACKNDDALLANVDFKVLEEYFRTRKIEVLPIDMISKTIKGELVTMFRCRPMTVAGETIVENYGASGSRNAILGAHIVEAANCPEFIFKINKEGVPEPTEDSLNGLDAATREELYQVIVESARGADGDERGFTSPAGWRQQKMMSGIMPAGIARLAREEIAPTAGLPASETGEDTDSKDASQMPFSDQAKSSLPVVQ